MITSHGLSTACVAAAVTLAVGIGSATVASAQSSADVGELAAAMKRLEGRVAALEEENAHATQEAAAARAEARALRQKLGGATAMSAGPAPKPNAVARPPGIYAMATKAPPLTTVPTPNWSGVYFGAAFGGAWTRPQINSQERYTFINSTVSPPFVSGVATLATGTGSGPGA